MRQTTSTRGRPVGDHDARRREIAEATLTVIASAGLEGTTLRAIARAAGCTTGVLSHYFANKEEVLIHALERIFDTLDEAFEAAREQVRGLDALKSVALASLPLDEASGSLVSVWQSYVSKAENNPALASVIRERHGRIRDHFTALIRRGQHDGSIRSDIEAADLGDVVNAAIDGFARMAPLETARLPRTRLLHLIDTQLQLIAA